jgi:hypothetical protein
VQTRRCVHCGETAAAYHHHRGYKREHFLDVVPVCRECHQNVGVGDKMEYLGTEGLPLFEMGSEDKSSDQT